MSVAEKLEYEDSPDPYAPSALTAGFVPPAHHLLTIDPDQWILPATRKERTERLQRIRNKRIERAREHFPSFMEYTFGDERTGEHLEMQWFHDEWSRAMDTNSRLLIIAPRDHGKTTQIVGRVLWELGCNPNLRIKIVCASDGRAKERLFEIIQHLETNARVKEVFPDLRPADSGEWSKHKIIVQRTARHRDASIEAIGITSTATGGRCDLLIADDVVDRRNALSFPALREQIKQAWKSDWTNLLEPDSRIWYICTLWHKDDLSHQIMANPAFTTMYYQIDDQQRSMWPSKWPQHELRRRRLEIGSIEFNRGFRNMVMDEDTGIVRPAWIQYADLASLPAFVDRFDDLVFFTSYDTAVSTGDNADFSASVTIAVDRTDRRVYVVDAWAARLTIKQQSEQVFREWRKYRPFRILIEKVGQAVLDEWVLNDHPDLAGIVEVTHPSVGKVQRLLGVTPLMERGQVIFASHLDPNGKIWHPRRGNLIGELEDFPLGKHDDLVDAYSQALNSARGYLLDHWAAGDDNTLDVRISGDGIPSPDGEPYYPF